MEYIRKQVKEMVKRLGFKQTAQKIGVSETSVRNWINKNTKMSIYSLDLIEDAYKLFKQNKKNNK